MSLQSTETVISSFDTSSNIDRNLPNIAIGVLNYNRADEAIRALRTFTKINYPPEKVRLVLLDNASSDNSVERAIREFGEKVEIMRMKQNLGPVARNRVMLSLPEDYLFVFDEDCCPEHADTIRNVVTFMETESDFGALCFACWNPRLGIREFGHPGAHYKRRWPGGTYEGIYVIGAGMCFRKSMINNIEGYDERLFWGGEEFDLSLELLYNNIRIAFHPDFLLIHNQARRAHTSKRAAELDMRNNIWISVRRFPFGLVPLITTALIGRRLLAGLLKRDWVRLRGYLRGIRTGLTRLPEFIATRRAVSFRDLMLHFRWFGQIFYTSRSYAASHKKGLEALLKPD